MEILRSMLGQLGINESFFVMLAIFVVTFLLLSQIALKKLSRTLIEREERTEGREHEADHLHKNLEALREKVKSAVHEARVQANVEFLAIRSKASDEQRRLVTEARASAGETMKKTRNNVGEQFAAEIKKLEEDIPKISKAINEKLLDTHPSKNAVESSLTSELE